MESYFINEKSQNILQLISTRGRFCLYAITTVSLQAIHPSIKEMVLKYAIFPLVMAREFCIK